MDKLPAGETRPLEDGTRLVDEDVEPLALLARRPDHAQGRPVAGRGQGARLTAWELGGEGVPYAIIADNAAGHYMQRGQVDAVIVGADRIAANGDAANKIGTYSLSVLAKQHGVPFYIAAPSSTFDLSIAGGDEIPIEQRESSEVTRLAGVPTAPDGVAVYNPAFDVTPAHNITAIITEKGVVENPDAVRIRRLLGTP